MNSIHDMGGMHGFGSIELEADEPVFHEDWERRVFAMNSALGAIGYRTLDESRHSRERLDPALYLASSYYQRWIEGVELLLLEKGLISRDELDGTAEPGPPPARTADGLEIKPALAADRVEPVLRGGASARVDEDIAPRFKAGDSVLARNINPRGHTRIPRYVRGRRGVIDRGHGVFLFPDTNAHGKGKSPQHCYSVRFEGSELWGPDAGPRDAVYVDLWDDYLDPA